MNDKMSHSLSLCTSSNIGVYTTLLINTVSIQFPDGQTKVPCGIVEDDLLPKTVFKPNLCKTLSMFDFFDFLMINHDIF